MPDSFLNYAQYYDIFYQNKDYAAEADFVARVIKQHRPGAQTLLDIGCGTGRHLHGLSEIGFDVCGIDRSPEMIGIAKKRHPGLPFYCARAEELRLDKSFDVVISLFHVLSYMQSDRQVRGYFEAISRHLSQGGLALFDFWHGPGVLNLRPESRFQVYEDDALKIRRYSASTLDESKNTVTVDYDILATAGREVVAEVAESHSLRYFFQEDIKAFLSGAALQYLGLYRWGHMQAAPSKQDWAAYALCRKCA